MIDSGVDVGLVPANKIKKVPIPIDIHFFDPEAAEPLELPLPPNTTHSASDYFKFISVFKMEDRKGWDILLRAFWEEFGPGTLGHELVQARGGCTHWLACLRRPY